jgi:hypothetical protein
MRVTLRIVFAIAVAYLGFLSAIAVAMRQPPDVFGAIMARMPQIAFLVLPFETLWTSARAGHLHSGELAPDFMLKSPDGASEIRLSSFRGHRPVVLVFGSYT